jgi:hypothetical protein
MKWLKILWAWLTTAACTECKKVLPRWKTDGNLWEDGRFCEPCHDVVNRRAHDRREEWELQEEVRKQLLERRAKVKVDQILAKEKRE